MNRKASANLPFEASANLQRLIGRELIPNEEVAFIELVKNSYDSGARKVTIVLQAPSEKEPGYIEIRDDGEGMTLDALKNLFMIAGYSERPEQVGSTKRMPTGEKGIGRFASDKLGKRLTVSTKVKGNAEGIQLEINWEDFSNKTKRFHDITAAYTVTPVPGLGQQDKGTVLRITSLRGRWPSEKRASVREALASLLDPFRRPTDFEIDLQVIGSDKLSGPIKQEQPGQADIEVEFRILKDGSIKRQLGGLLYSEPRPNDNLPASNATKSLKGLTGRLFYTTRRPPKSFSKGLPPGVRIYRDGFRIEPFGSPTADWLGISEKRAKRAGHAHIVPSRLFGFIEISREAHPKLIDTTSRQALLDDEAARELVTFLKAQLAFLEDTIRETWTEPRWEVSKSRQAAQFEESRLQALGVLSAGLAHELRQPMQTIRWEADNIITRLKQLDINDEVILGSQNNIDVSIERINDNINLVAELSTGSLKDIEEFDLAEMLHSECQLFERRCNALGIGLVAQIPRSQLAKTNRTTITQVLFNLLQNAMQALQESTQKNSRQISITLTRMGNMHRIEVTDNGPGIPDEIRPKLFKKFATKKTGGTGTGLYYCHSILGARGGSITFVSRKGIGTTFTVNVPEEGT
jgi:signal transduction histidine kinase